MRVRVPVLLARSSLVKVCPAGVCGNLAQEIGHMWGPAETSLNSCEKNQVSQKQSLADFY